MSFIQDEQFGEIVDFDELRVGLRKIYDVISPEFNSMRVVELLSEVYDNSPSHMIAAGASILAYQMLPAAGAHDLAEQVKGDGKRGNIFSLGWTEEHTGSDLLSIKTTATPASDDPDEENFHIRGHKWMINNSYHADYHCVLAKIDPEQSGPRSLSLFLVPRSSTKNWQRLPTHVLRNMVLTEYDIDGPGILVGKKGHGLTIVQQMAAAARYECTYVGMNMVREAVPKTIDWLSSKNIFGKNPIEFSNVFRQLYNLALQSASLEFMYYRARALNAGSWLMFHGTMLKSWMLLRTNEVLSQNLLVAGSKGFVAESEIGRNVIDSFVLPVFDGHYTVNTFMTAKHAPRYLHAEDTADAEERLEFLRDEMYCATPHDEMNFRPRDVRQPDFFDMVDYIQQLELPINLPVEDMVENMRKLMDEVESFTSISSDPEYKYKAGDLLHWMESVTAAAEMYAVTRYDHYLNAVIQQYNAFTKAFNDVVSEGNLDVPFFTPMRQLPLPNVDNAREFLMDLINVQQKIKLPNMARQQP
ncbi:MAG: acyl-CoA dehydrogenase family protein [Chloroflexota bacterium]